MNKKKAKHLRRAGSIMAKGAPTKAQMKVLKKRWKGLSWKQKTQVTKTGKLK